MKPSNHPCLLQQMTTRGWLKVAVYTILEVLITSSKVLCCVLYKDTLDFMYASFAILFGFLSLSSTTRAVSSTFYTNTKKLPSAQSSEKKFNIIKIVKRCHDNLFDFIRTWKNISRYKQYFSNTMLTFELKKKTILIPINLF